MRFLTYLCVTLALIVTGGCKDEPSDTGDTGDTGVEVEDYPCDAAFLPFDFLSRRYSWTNYRGRFDQVESESEVVLEQFGEYEVPDDADIDWDPEDIVVCQQSLLMQFMQGGDFALFGVDDEWLYLVGDGDQGAKEPTTYWLEEAIPLLPLEPADTYQEIYASEYNWEWGDPGTVTADIWLASTSEAVTVEAGTFDAVKTTWEIVGLDPQKRYFSQMDVTTYFDEEEGVVRQSWYNEGDDTSVVVELLGY